MPKYDKVVAISLTLDSYLEVIEFDTNSKTILKYENTIVDYNKNERKIEDLENFEETLKEIFLHLDIAPGSPVIISLPDIYISQRIYSARMAGTALETEIKQDLVSTKLFDDINPVARWKQLSVDEDEDTQFVLYSGMKEDIVEYLKRVITGLGMDLLAIDNSSFALIKGVIESGFATEEDLEAESDGWAILSLTQDQYEMIALTGKSITSLTQEPLTYDGTIGIYNKIADVIMPAVESLWIANLIIVNTVPGISSQELANRMALDFPVHCMDINENASTAVYNVADSVDPEKALNISPYVVGTGLYQNYLELGFDFAFDNMKFKISSGGLMDFMEVFSGRKARKSVINMSVLICGILLVVAILVFMFYLLQHNTINKLNAEKSDLEIRLSTIKPKDTSGFDLKQRTKQLYEKDKNISNSLSLVSDVIPDNLWIKEFYVYPDLSVYIRGYSYNVSDIIEFYKALKTFSKFNDLKISQILLAGEGKDSTNSNVVATNPDGTPIKDDQNTGADLPAPPSATPDKTDATDPSALPTLPGVNDDTTGGLPGAPGQSVEPNDIPNEPCYEFIIGNKR